MHCVGQDSRIVFLTLFPNPFQGERGGDTASISNESSALPTEESSSLLSQVDKFLSGRR